MTNWRWSIRAGAALGTMLLDRQRKLTLRNGRERQEHRREPERHHRRHPEEEDDLKRFLRGRSWSACFSSA